MRGFVDEAADSRVRGAAERMMGSPVVACEEIRPARFRARAGHGLDLSRGERRPRDRVDRIETERPAHPVFRYA